MSIATLCVAVAVLAMDFAWLRHLRHRHLSLLGFPGPALDAGALPMATFLIVGTAHVLLDRRPVSRDAVAMLAGGLAGLSAFVVYNLACGWLDYHDGYTAVSVYFYKIYRLIGLERGSDYDGYLFWACGVSYTPPQLIVAAAVAALIRGPATGRPRPGRDPRGIPMIETEARPSLDDVAEIYRTPVMDLIFRAAEVHRAHHDPSAVQVCVLLSVKTGGCPEDCGYCPQAARYHTAVEAEPLMELAPVLEAAARAKASGASRFCMGAAWREVKDDRRFDRVLEMIRGVKDLGLEACCTLGMVTESQARRMKEAGLDAYNHNLDTSEAFYDRIIQTRTYRDRLDTLAAVRDAGITVCSGGIVGMGESDDDRIALIHTLAGLPEPPESVPINALVAVEGTPLADRPNVSIWDMVRTIATARILMPRAMVRLSAGRLGMSESDQALCFLAGANSIFAGDKLLTTPNPANDRDAAMFDRLGLKPLVPAGASGGMG